MKNFLFFITLFLFFIQNVVAQTWSNVSFTVVERHCPTVPTGSEIYISQIYDHKTGSFGVIQIYNPTDRVINLNNYTYRRRGDYNPSPPKPWTTNIALIGLLQPYSIYLIGVGVTSTSPIICNNPNYDLTLNGSHGINDDDQIQLLKNGVVIDELRVDKTGTSMIRRPTAIAPKSVYTASDWYTGEPNCVTVGTPPLLDILKVERNITLPDYSLCKLPARIKLTLGGGSGVYQISNDNGATYKPFINPWWTDISTSGDNTLFIQDKKNTGCYIKFKFDVVQNLLPKIAPIEMN